jgi:hypothetical protein
VYNLVVDAGPVREVHRLVTQHFKPDLNRGGEMEITVATPFIHCCYTVVILL